MSDELKDMFRSSSWQQASEQALKQKGFWPNRLFWSDVTGSAIGVAFNGNSDEYSVNQALLQYLVEAKNQGRRTECYFAFFIRHERLEDSEYRGHISAAAMSAKIANLPPNEGKLGLYWWVNLAEMRAGEEIPF